MRYMLCVGLICLCSCSEDRAAQPASERPAPSIPALANVPAQPTRPFSPDDVTLHVANVGGFESVLPDQQSSPHYLIKIQNGSSHPITFEAFTRDIPVPSFGIEVRPGTDVEWQHVHAYRLAGVGCGTGLQAHPIAPGESLTFVSKAIDWRPYFNGPLLIEGQEFRATFSFYVRSGHGSAAHRVRSPLHRVEGGILKAKVDKN